MLTKHLRELEEAGLIVRKIYTQVPPKVEYSLSKRGETLQPVIRALEKGVKRISPRRARNLRRRRKHLPEGARI